MANDAGIISIKHLVPPSNISRYLRYFDDIKVLVGERDPRDIYIFEKYILKGTVVPIDDIENFCRWFEATRVCRKSENMNTDQILLVQFEDLIYKYDETTEKIKDFLELHEENHINKLEFFNPEISVKNTRLFADEKYKNEAENMQYIEKRLTEYLYDYSEIK